MPDYAKLTRGQLARELETESALLRGLSASDATQRLVHDLHVHQIELEIQNQDLRESQRRLEEARDRYADLYDFAPIGYVSLDQRGNILGINLTGASMLGTERSHLTGKSLSAWMMPESIPVFFQHLQKVFASQRKVTGGLKMRVSGDKLCEIDIESVVARDAISGTLSCLSVLTDNTERKISERLQYLAHYDSLTGLPNRILLQDRLTQAIAAAQRSQRKVALLFIDLDRFKNVNDSLGHEAGDHLLQGVAERLKACVRKIDTVARIGGDEFIVVLPGLGENRDISHVTGKIFDVMSAAFTICGHEINIMPSIGISIYPDDGTDTQTLIRNADAAMYHSRKPGPSRYQYYTEEMNTRALQNLFLENSLRLAIDQKGLELHYQPQIDIHTGQIVGAEALVRWHHPEMSWVSPETFIHIAEDRGFISRVFEQVLHMACTQIRQWQQAGLPIVPVAVNVSPSQIFHSGLADSISDVLHEMGVDSQYLEIEISETERAYDVQAVIPVAQKLRTMGIRLSIDNFGAGYFPLKYLGDIGIYKLKIGRRITGNLMTNPGATSLLSAIVSMAKELKLKVVAEGVETGEQLEILRTLGCDLVQGYYFSKPVTGEEFSGLLTGKARLQP